MSVEVLIFFVSCILWGTTGDNVLLPHSDDRLASLRYGLSHYTPSRKTANTVTPHYNTLSPHCTSPFCISSKPSLILSTVASAVGCLRTSMTVSLPTLLVVGLPAGWERRISDTHPGVR